jgi:uroporphyrinogen-III synthase
MISQREFDRLRRTCSAQLAQFISEARRTERHVQRLRLPVGVETDLQFLSQRGVEFDACYEYLIACRQLTESLRQQAQSIQ